MISPFCPHVLQDQVFKDSTREGVVGGSGKARTPTPRLRLECSQSSLDGRGVFDAWMNERLQSFPVTYPLSRDELR